MADTANRLISAPQDEGGEPDAFLAIPGISEADARFLDQLWLDLRTADDPQPLGHDAIQQNVEAALRAKPEVAAYQRGLLRLAKAHPNKAQTAAVHVQQIGSFSNTQSHFIELTVTATKIQWRFYINPAPASAPDLLTSLHQRISMKGVLDKVGMKISSYDGLCRCRDGIVLYTDDANKQAVLDAIAEEGGVANRQRFNPDLVRFTKPVANGLAGLGPDPQGQADLWLPLVDEWREQNKGWMREQPAWGTNPQYMSYNLLLGSVLTTCYLLARSYRPRTHARRTQQTNVTVPEDALRAQYRHNVISAFKAMAINPSTPSLTPSVEGVGWLRYRFFPSLAQ